MPKMPIIPEPGEKTSSKTNVRARSQRAGGVVQNHGQTFLRKTPWEVDRMIKRRQDKIAGASDETSAREAELRAQDAANSGDPEDTFDQTLMKSTPPASSNDLKNSAEPARRIRMRIWTPVTQLASRLFRFSNITGKTSKLGRRRHSRRLPRRSDGRASD